MTPTLTLNLGLRYDLFTPYAEDNGLQANFVPNGGTDRAAHITFPRPPAVIQQPAFETLLATDGIKKVCSAGLDTGTYTKTNFAPRLGSPSASPRGMYCGPDLVSLIVRSIPSDTVRMSRLNYPFYYNVNYVTQTDHQPLHFPDPNTGGGRLGNRTFAHHPIRD